MKEHIVNNLGRGPTAGDGALYFKRVTRRATRITGSYVDDALNAEDSQFGNRTEKTLPKFESKQRVYSIFKFYGT